MKTHRLSTYWTPEDAEAVITFLAEIRDLLWECYRDEIMELHRKELEDSTTEPAQNGLPFDDEINF